MGSVGFPDRVSRPFVAMKMMGSMGEKTCFTSQLPRRVAEKELTMREYMIGLQAMGRSGT
jgi:hypothetical protein